MNYLPMRSQLTSRVFKQTLFCSILISTLCSVAVARPNAKLHHKATAHSVNKIKNHNPTKTVSNNKQRGFKHLANYIHTRYKRTAPVAHEITSALTEAATKFSLDKYLIAAVVAKESSFKASSNNAGNIGLMQIHRSVNGKTIRKEGDKNITNIRSNIMVGSSLLRECLDTEARGNISHALSLYNRGCSKKNRTKKIKAGDGYAKRVLKEFQLARNYIPQY